MEHETIVLQGRELGASELAEIRGLIATHPQWSRYRLSRVLCERWNWRTATGQMKDMAARTLLLKLEARGLVQLPARRWASPNRMRRKRLVMVAHTREPVVGCLADLQPLEIVELSQAPAELALFETLLHEYHYLGHTSTVGMNLKYLVRDRHGRLVACALFGSAAWKCAARDRFIGWSAPTRARHLQRITNNTRFLIPAWVEVPHLASHVLGRIVRRLRADWRGKYADSKRASPNWKRVWRRTAATAAVRPPAMACANRRHAACATSPGANPGANPVIPATPSGRSPSRITSRFTPSPSVNSFLSTGCGRPVWISSASP